MRKLKQLNNLVVYSTNQRESFSLSLSLSFITSYQMVVYVLQCYTNVQFRHFLTANDLADACLHMLSVIALYNSPHLFCIQSPDQFYLCKHVVQSINCLFSSLCLFSLFFFFFFANRTVIELEEQNAQCRVQSNNGDSLFLASEWARVGHMAQFWPKRWHQMSNGNFGNIFSSRRETKLHKEEFIFLMCEDMKPYPQNSPYTG